MFNTYQELVDRINYLIEERTKMQKKVARMEEIYSKIPGKVINQMYEQNKITKQERIFWEILKMRKVKKNVSSNNKN